MTEQQKPVVVRGPEAMHALGRQIGMALRPGDVVMLHGDLGAGKTTLTQGIAQALGVESAIQSPTFTLMSEYAARFADDREGTLRHLDLYRLDDPDELENIGWEEVIAPEDGVAIIEWPERAGEWLPERYLLVAIVYKDADSRKIIISGSPPERAAELTNVLWGSGPGGR